MSTVTVTRDTVVLPTYHPLPPDRNPMFLEKRVYQGSSGKVYPLPFTDRVASERVEHAWEAIHLENEFLRVMILPQIGGRIHVGQDKTNGYDFFYRQDVIKPALVGLAGSWISGGVEFNWPQHHRPSTFMPADAHIESHPDGSRTVWLGDHDPMNRLKGMHGVCLHPGKAYLELKVRVHNRTEQAQTFLWWANVATRVHELYQSFFPPDVTYVADHAKRATSRFPLCDDRYYGVDYGSRPRDGVPPSERPPAYVPPPGRYAPNDLSWYANIPVPTSYMCMGTEEDFFGGYDHARQAGVVHVANHHIAPGKKQWTWGNHRFGYAWDRNLTDADAAGEHAPYIELMAGVFTDNQPDFSHLMPGETRSWSQFWYPIQHIGPAHQANIHAAASLRVDTRDLHLGVAVTSARPAAVIRLHDGPRLLQEWRRDLHPGTPFVETVRAPRTPARTGLRLTVHSAEGEPLLAYSPPDPAALATRPVPPAATEPPAPADISSNDELHLTGLHLEQYRHATRAPEAYWREALRRDPGDSRCHLALGRWHLRRGEFADAERHLRAAIARQTLRNPNPADGEAHYQLGLVLRHRALAAPTSAERPALLHAAYAALYKATWNHAWRSASHHALAEIDCWRQDWPAALDHLDRCLRLDADHLRARHLRAAVLRRLGRAAEADAVLAATLALDPLDHAARHLAGQPLACDAQVRLDLAHDYVRAGFLKEADSVLDYTPASSATARPADLGAAPLLAYTRAWIAHLAGDAPARARHLAAARSAAPDHCFPARLEEIYVLESAIAADSGDARAPFYFGHLLYDRRRHREAIAHWKKAVALEPANAVAWRCLGIGAFNILQKPALARSAYERAVRAAPHDARLLYERDQLWKRLRVPARRRLAALSARPDLVALRDDLAVELSALHNQTGRPELARALLASRVFQPWEGGEGQALGQHVRTHLALGRRALAADDAPGALALFTAALDVPARLGEDRHPLANASDIHYWLGCAHSALGDAARARAHWLHAAEFKGDFQDMSVRAYSELTYYSALSLARLGRAAEAKKLLLALAAHARALAKQPARIDYFATSLPTMLLFEDDLSARQKTTALFLEAQALAGLGQKKRARALLAQVLERDPAHPLAADLLAER
jgi:tetratricopeptide (TPR) repeat protein